MKLRELPGSLSGEAAENPALRTVVMNAMMQYAPILEFVEFYQVTGNADSPRKKASADGGQKRTINDEYADNKIDPDWGSVSLVIYGDIVQTDIANHRRGLDLASARLTDITAFTQNFGKNFQYALINDTDFGLLGASLVPASRVTSFSSDLSTDAKRKNLVMSIKDAMVDIAGGADFVMMSKAVLSEISSLSMEYVKYAPAGFGGYVPTIDGVRIVVAGTNSAGAQTLPATTGAGSNATKIIVGRYGEKSNIAAATSVGLQVKDLGLVGTAYETLVELDIDQVILDNSAVAVIDEIQNP